MSRSWVWFALASAFFAGLTALFGKLGVASINSNMATLIRVVVIFFVTAALVASRGERQRLDAIAARTWIFLVLSGVATGRGCATTARSSSARCRASRRSTR